METRTSWTRILLPVLLLTSCAGPVLDLPEPTALELADARFVLAQAPLPPAPRPITDHVAVADPTATKIRDVALLTCYRLQAEVCDEIATNLVLVADDPDTINAYADQDDQITVYTGLMDRLAEPELAAVLAHEYAHVMLGHVGKSQTNALVGGVALSVLLGGVSAATGVTFEPGSYVEMADLGMTVGSRVYSPEMELEADRLAVYMISEAGYPRTAMRDALVRLHRAHAEAQTSGLGAVGFLETHPSDDRRIAHVLTAMDEVRAGVPFFTPPGPTRPGIPAATTGP